MSIMMSVSMAAMLLVGAAFSIWLAKYDHLDVM
jgi:hypothetical protein